MRRRVAASARCPRTSRSSGQRAFRRLPCWLGGGRAATPPQHRRGRPAPAAPAPAGAAARRTTASRRGPAGVIRQILHWLDTPDSFVGFLPACLWRGLRLVRRFRPAAIHASGPPFSIVLAGAILSRAARLPLVVDFRDAWTLDPSDPFGALGGEFTAFPSRSRTRLLRALERWCLSVAKAVVFTSEATRDLYARSYPAHAPRMHVIYNGAAFEDFAGESRPFESPTVAHVGTLHHYQEGQVMAFLDAFAASRRSGGLPAGARAVFVGSVGAVLLAALQQAALRLGLTGCVEFTGPVAHAEAVQWMRRSRILLSFVGANRYVRLSKLSEYVAAGTPILAFAPADSETARETRLYGGRVVDEGTGQAASALCALIATADRRAPLSEPHPLSRRTEAGELARLLAVADGVSRSGSVLSG